MMQIMSVQRSLYWGAGVAAAALFLANIAQLRFAMDEMIWLQISVYLFFLTTVLAWCGAIGFRALVIFVCGLGTVVVAFIVSQLISVPFMHAAFSSHVGPVLFGTPVVLMILFPAVCLTSVALLVTDDENAFDWIFDAAIFTTLIYAVMDAVLAAERIQTFASGAWSVFGVPFLHIIGVFVVSCAVCSIAVALIKKVIGLRESEGTHSIALIAMLLLFGVTTLKYPLLLPSIISFSLIAFLYLRFFDHLRKPKKTNL